jgi:cell division protein FtsB
VKGDRDAELEENYLNREPIAVIFEHENRPRKRRAIIRLFMLLLIVAAFLVRDRNLHRVSTIDAFW